MVISELSPLAAQAHLPPLVTLRVIGHVNWTIRRLFVDAKLRAQKQRRRLVGNPKGELAGGFTTHALRKATWTGGLMTASMLATLLSKRSIASRSL